MHNAQNLNPIHNTNNAHLQYMCFYMYSTTLSEHVGVFQWVVRDTFRFWRVHSTIWFQEINAKNESDQ